MEYIISLDTHILSAHFPSAGEYNFTVRVGSETFGAVGKPCFAVAVARPGSCFIQFNPHTRALSYEFNERRRGRGPARASEHAKSAASATAAFYDGRTRKSFHMVEQLQRELSLSEGQQGSTCEVSLMMRFTGPAPIARQRGRPTSQNNDVQTVTPAQFDGRLVTFRRVRMVMNSIATPGSNSSTAW